MPLSEHEQQILKEIEKHLHEEDPRFAHRIEPQASDGSKRLRGGIALFVAGLLTLFGFFVTHAWFVGVAAYAAMVAGIVMVASGLRARFASSDPKVRMASVVERWEQRLRQRYRKKQ